MVILLPCHKFTVPNLLKRLVHTLRETGTEICLHLFALKNFFKP